MLHVHVLSGCLETLRVDSQCSQLVCRFKLHFSNFTYIRRGACADCRSVGLSLFLRGNADRLSVIEELNLR